MVKLGRISYVNMAPVFFRVDADVEEIQGVPTELNRRLIAGELDTAPISHGGSAAAATRSTSSRTSMSARRTSAA